MGWAATVSSPSAAANGSGANAPASVERPASFNDSASYSPAISASASRRLRLARAAAAHGAAVLVGSPYRVSGCAAGAVVTSGRGRADWNAAGASRLLSGLRTRLYLSKRIGHSDTGNAPVVLATPEAAFRLTESDNSNTDQKFEIRNPKFEIPTEGRNRNVAAI